MNKNQARSIWLSINEMLITVIEYQRKRDFEKLVELYDKQLEFMLVGKAATLIAIGKIYCLCRLNKKEEAVSLFMKVKSSGLLRYLDEVMNDDIELILRIFIEEDGNKLPKPHINALKTLLKCGQSHSNVSIIVFDYEDLVGECQVFDTNWTKTRHKIFTSSFLKSLFIAMQRDDDEIVYYDRHNNDILIYVRGYFVSLLLEREETNQILAQRIYEQDSYDVINDDIHFLIPQISMIEYISILRSHSLDYPILLSVLQNIEDDLSKQCEEEKIEIALFSLNISFFEALNAYLLGQPVIPSPEIVDAVITISSEFASRKWLYEINEINS
jgi:hypothetical protein